MDLYEDGLYLLMLVAATVLVAVVITLMTKSMLKKKHEPTGQLTIPAGASTQQAADAKSDQEPADKPEDKPEEQRQEQLQSIAPVKQLQQAPEKPGLKTEALDGKEAEIEIGLEEEEDTGEDTMETRQIALPGIEKEDSILSAVEESDDLMNLFQSVEDDNSELAELAARLQDVDLESLKVLSQETFLALSKRTSGKKEE